MNQDELALQAQQMDLNQENAQYAQNMNQGDDDQDVDDQYADEIPEDNSGATPPNDVDDQQQNDDGQQQMIGDQMQQN